MPRNSPLPPAPRAVCLMLTLTLLMLLPGCAVVPWTAHGVAGGAKTVKVEAEHRGLEGQRVAVMVAADDRTLFYSPNAPRMICRVVTGHLVEHLADIQATAPRRVTAYQDQNPYWPTMRAGNLVQQMGVDRLVLIDLVEYRTHEPGNAHLFKGQVTANVAVHSADSDDPDNPTFYQTVSTQFPPDTSVGVVNADTQQIEMGMVKLFGQDVARLFYDHEVQRE